VATLAPEAQSERTERVLHRQRREHPHLGRVAGCDRQKAGQGEHSDAKHDEFSPVWRKSIVLRRSSSYHAGALVGARVIRGGRRSAQ
jgi:hypothetical protein